MIAWDIASGNGVSVVDPHGGLIDDILDNHIPRHRANDVIYFNPKDQEQALAMNILECSQPEQRGLVVSHVVSIFHRLWESSWGPRMEDILRNSLYALIEQPTPVSLLAMPKLLTDETYRAAIMTRVTNPSVLDFFHNTYNKLLEAAAVGAILAGPPFAIFSLLPDHLRTVLAVKGSLRRAQQRRALDRSGPFYSKPSH
jgi:hypothetical protein